MAEETVEIDGMDCSDCALVLEHSLGRMDGVLAVDVSYVNQRMRIEYDKQKITRGAIKKRVHSLGYVIPATGVVSWYQQQRELLFSLLAGLLLLTGWVCSVILAASPGLVAGFYIAAYIAGGWHVFRHAWRALRARRFDTDVLMLAAALGAAALGELAEGALLLFLFSLGHALEERALERARKAVRALGELAPSTALVQRDGQELVIPVTDLRIGDVVLVRPSVRIPVDGVVLSGRSSVDQSPVTGESLPVDKSPSDQVFSGTLNGAGVLRVRVTRLAKDSTLARVMRMVEEAQAQKSPTQQIVERFERVFVPVVLIGDLLIILFLPLIGVPFKDAFLRAMTLLVAASPCALALGAPATILAAVARAGRQGVLVKGGLHLENLGRIKAMAFDKTGTLTYGRPEVTDILDWRADHSDEQYEILGLAAAVENYSGHPLAQAVVNAAQERDLWLPEVSDIQEVAGHGVRAEVEGQLVQVGSLRLMEAAGVEVSGIVRQTVDGLQSEGKSVLLIALAGYLVGLIAVADKLRSNANETMQALRQRGVRELLMLTGDNERVAAAIARQAGMSGYQAGLMPEDKLDALRGMVKRYGLVAMVGDGVNDAPALANATVGIAMGGAGTDAALESADVALMGDDLANLPFAVGLGRATRAVILQNLTIALGIIALLVTASLVGWTGIGITVFIHEGSTLVVVLNALRLLGYQDLSSSAPG